MAFSDSFLKVGNTLLELRQVLFFCRFCKASVRAMLHAPAALGPIERGPDPQERPNNVEGKKAYPAGDVNSICMWVVTLLRDQVRNIMQDDNSIKG